MLCVYFKEIFKVKKALILILANTKIFLLRASAKNILGIIWKILTGLSSCFRDSCYLKLDLEFYPTGLFTDSSYSCE